MLKLVPSLGEHRPPHKVWGNGCVVPKKMEQARGALLVVFDLGKEN